jgi:hypothetical protein
MARASSPRRVQCYHCGHRFEVSGIAQSVPCPKCHKPLIVADQEVKSGVRGPLRELKTCGKVIVAKKARLICEHIEAHNGITCEGILDTKKLITGRTLHIGKAATFKGNVHAKHVVIEAGAKITNSLFAVPDDPRKLFDLHDPTPEVES